MAYLVLARKYRPTTLADMVGQEHVVRTLQNAIAMERVHHAFLFTGARGVGKTSMARILARALNCETGATATPCGTCGMCQEILAGKSSAVLEIDGASNTGVDHVRELRENVCYLPGRGRYKLYIIDEVHMLSQAAFNALLKTLEEPPPHVKFVFATTEPHKIPVTILSRCQRFDFRRVSVPVLTEHVRKILAQEGLSLGPSTVAAVVREAQGSVRDALSLLDQVLSYGGDGLSDEQVLEALGVVDRQTVFALADRILARDAKAVLAVVSDVDRRGHELASLATLLAEHWRDVAVLKQIGADAGHLDRSQGELDDLAAQAKQRSQADLQRLFRQTLVVAEDVTRSAMPRVSLEMGLLRLLEIAPVVDMTTLLQRLDALVAGTPGNPPAGGGRPQGLVSSPGSAERPRSGGGAISGAEVAGAEVGTAAGAIAEHTSPAAAPLISAGAGLGTAADNEAWGRFVDRVRAQRPAVASVLEHGRLVSFVPLGVEIAYEPNTFYWDAARDGETQTLLGKILQEQFGQAVPLKIVALQEHMAVGLSLAQISEQRRQAFEQGVHSGALGHPAVQCAVSVLGAEVQEVRPLGHHRLPQG